MASKTCTSCLWAIQRQSRSMGKVPKLAGRTFTTTSTRCAEPATTNTKPNAKAPSLSQPVKSSPTGAQSQTTPVLKKLAISLTNKNTAYTAYAITKVLYEECGNKANYTMPKVAKDAEPPRTEEGEDLGVGDSWWHTEVGLKPTFSTWSQVTMLHMYLLTVRFRCFPKEEAQSLQQHLLDHFFGEAEKKMSVNHNMHSASVRNRYLKDLYIQWRGLLAVYDEGLLKGDAVLATAIWRNLFKGSEEVDIRRLAEIVSFMRSVLQGLDSTSNDHVGRVRFGSPKDQMNTVRLKSPMMDLPFPKTPETNPPAKSA